MLKPTRSDAMCAFAAFMLSFFAASLLVIFLTVADRAPANRHDPVAENPHVCPTPPAAKPFLILCPYCRNSVRVEPTNTGSLVGAGK